MRTRMIWLINSHCIVHVSSIIQFSAIIIGIDVEQVSRCLDQGMLFTFTGNDMMCLERIRGSKPKVASQDCGTTVIMHHPLLGTYRERVVMGYLQIIHHLWPTHHLPTRH